MSPAGIDLGRNIYVVAATVARANWMPYVAATLVLVGTDVGSGYLYAPLPFAVLRALTLMIVGYSAYRMLLSDGAVRGWRAIATPKGRVPWRYAGVMLIILGPILFLGIVWTSPHTGHGPDGLASIGLGLVMVGSYAALYVLLGTALPEVADTGVASFRRAFDRGRAHYRRIAQSMLFGPWLFRTASLLVMMGLSAAGVQTEPFSLDSRAFTPLGLLPLVGFTACHVFAEVMTAVVLTRAYRRFMPVERAEVPAHALASAPIRG